MKRLILVCSLCCLASFGIAQRLELIWEADFPESELRELIQLPDGKVVGVGAQRVRGNGLQGLFFEIDPIDGTTVRSSQFGRAKDDFLNDVIELPDGTYYLVGYRTPNGKKDKDAWFLQLAEDGETILLDTLLSYGGDDAFQFIALTEQNEAIIAGYHSRLNEGSMAIGRVIPSGVRWDDEPIGNGTFQDIIGMERNQDGDIWIFGNTRGTKDVDPNDIWMMGIDQSGNFSNSRTVYHGYPFEESLFKAFPTYDGGFVAVGRTKSNGLPDSDGWVVEIQPDGQITEDPILEKEGENRIVALYKYPWDEFYFGVLENLPCAFCPTVYQYDFVLWNKKENYHKLFDLPVIEGAPYEIIRLFKSLDDSFIIAGVTNPGSKKPGIRVMKVRFVDESNESVWSAGNGTKFDVMSLEQLVTCTEQPYIEQSPNPSFLTPGGRGPLSFVIKNVSGTPLGDGVATIYPEGPDGGINFKRNEAFIPYLAAGQSMKISFPVSGNPDLQEGSYRFKIPISYNGRTVLNLTAEIQVGNPKAFTNNASQVIINRRSSSIIVDNPRVGGNGGELTTTENSVSVDLTIISENPRLKAGDIKVYKNGRVIDDTKDVGRYLSDPIFQKEFYKYDFTFRMPLENDRNEIYAVLDDLTESARIIVNRTFRKPNLFLLGIAPSYSDIEYPRNDVLDFAEAIRQQAGSNIYDQIIVETLTDPEQTTAGEIAKVFEALPSRGIKGVPFQGDNDVLIVFYSGHGIKLKNGMEERFRLVGSDYNQDLKKSTTVDYRNEVQYYLDQIDAKKVMLIDACLSGSARGPEVDVELSHVLNRILDSSNGLVTISSCSSNELSYEDDAWENGAFTEALLEAVYDGGAMLSDGTEYDLDTNGNGFISIEELYQYLSIRVPDLVADEKNGATQHPFIPKGQLDLSLEFFRPINQYRK